MKFTEEEFTGKVKSNKGDFGVDDVNLSATCALFAVSGYYMNEFTGEKSSDKLTLHAITDLKDRKHVNINVLTELEYERVMKLVSKEKMSFDDAKMQAEKEILTALGLVDRFESFEGLSIYEKGDGNAALLATSVMLQSDLDAEKLTDRLDGFASSITESGEWDDEKMKKKMTDWADSAKSRGKYETIRDNLEKWSDSDEIPDFEKVVDEINKDAKETTQKIPEEWSWDVPQSARLNPNIKYDSMCGLLMSDIIVRRMTTSRSSIQQCSQKPSHVTISAAGRMKATSCSTPSWAVAQRQRSPVLLVAIISASRFRQSIATSSVKGWNRPNRSSTFDPIPQSSAIAR